MGVLRSSTPHQGCQFTSEAFTGCSMITLSPSAWTDAAAHSTTSSLKALAQRQARDVYLEGYEARLLLGLADLRLYSGEQPHQALGNRTPRRCTARGPAAGRTSWTVSAKNWAAPTGCDSTGGAARIRAVLGMGTTKTNPCVRSSDEQAESPGGLKLCEGIAAPNPREPCGRRRNYT